MENQKIVRLIDDLGRIVLPAEARSVMDWSEKTPVEIWVNPAGDEIVLRRHTSTCAYCGSTERLKAFQTKHICSSCQDKIAKL